jgi:hypothetical protein
VPRLERLGVLASEDLLERGDRPPAEIDGLVEATPLAEREGAVVERDEGPGAPLA